jgi:hypothetical protein
MVWRHGASGRHGVQGPLRGQPLASVILSTLPLGLGIALNPIAIVAGILILRTAQPRLNGLVFAIGWVLGLLVLVGLSTSLIQGQVGGDREPALDLPSVIWVAIGAVLLIAATRAFRGRPVPGEAIDPPRWLRVIDQAGVPRLFGIGAFLATVSLRNLALLAAAAGVIGQADLGFVELALTVAAFVFISSIGMLIPLLVRVFGGADADARLARWSDWLNRHMVTMTAGVMGVLGGYLLARGLMGVF